MQYFQLTMNLSGHNPILSEGAPVHYFACQKMVSGRERKKSKARGLRSGWGEVQNKLGMLRQPSWRRGHASQDEEMSRLGVGRGNVQAKQELVQRP